MIREMTLDDLNIVCEMELRLFSSPWPRESYEYELKENPYSHLFVAENEEGTIVGYAGVWTTFDQAQITTIGVDPVSYTHLDVYKRQVEGRADDWG